MEPASADVSAGTTVDDADADVLSAKVCKCVVCMDDDAEFLSKEVSVSLDSMVVVPSVGGLLVLDSVSVDRLYDAMEVGFDSVSCASANVTSDACGVLSRSLVGELMASEVSLRPVTIAVWTLVVRDFGVSLGNVSMVLDGDDDSGVLPNVGVKADSLSFCSIIALDSDTPVRDGDMFSCDDS